MARPRFAPLSLLAVSTARPIYVSQVEEKAKDWTELPMKTEEVLRRNLLYSITRTSAARFMLISLSLFDLKIMLSRIFF